MNDQNQIVECVPNFSEGRDADIIDAIYKSILSDGTAQVWDYCSDTYHNRSVFTLAGSPEAIENAVLNFTRTAASLIDMETHTGVHPCIGSTDVIPFIPLKNISMEECVSLSEKVGERIAKELNLPVYLYAQSAKIPSHKRLADIRRGGFSTLKTKIACDPDRFPDFGPRTLTSAGGVSIGARNILIAFNVFLNTDDLNAARQIAKKIRESSGGLPGIQAIGLSVNNLAQVSMNLLDYHKTSMKKVFDVICEEAAKFSLSPLYSELIGMIPRDALTGTNASDLMIQNFSERLILENHFC